MNTKDSRLERMEAFTKQLGGKAVLGSDPAGNRFVETFGDLGYTGIYNSHTAIHLYMPTAKKLVRINPDWGDDFGFFMASPEPIKEDQMRSFESVYNRATQPTEAYGVPFIVKRYGDGFTSCCSDSIHLVYVPGTDKRVIYAHVDNHDVPKIWILAWFKNAVKRYFLKATDVVVYPVPNDWAMLQDFGYTVPEPKYPNGTLVIMEQATRYTAENSLFSVVKSEMLHSGREVYCTVQYEGTGRMQAEKYDMLYTNEDHLKKAPANLFTTDGRHNAE